MDDEATKALLGSVAISSMIPVAPHCVAILRSRIEQTGADITAVEDYIARHGGSKSRTAPITRRDLGPSHGKQIPGADYYAVPRAALPPD